MTNLRPRNAGIVVAILFGGGNIALAAALVGGWWPIPVGLGTFALVVIGHQLTDRWTRPLVVLPPAEPAQTAPLPTTPLPAVPPPEPAAVSRRSRVPKKVAVVFVHGILSSAQAWASFERLIYADPDLDALKVEMFEYNTPVAELRPWRQVPDLTTVSHWLRTRFEELESQYETVVIVAHSMGGLVTLQFVARMLEDGEGTRLTRIRNIVLFACPTAGSDFLRTVRRLLRMVPTFRHVQERALRPLDADMTRVQELILNKVVHATETSDQTCPISLRLYAGATDRIVTRPSAHGPYPHRCTRVVGGDHFEIIRPDSPDHESYRGLKRVLIEALAEVPS